MEGLKIWALSLCITAIAAAMIQMLMLKGSMEKAGKTVLRIFLLATLVSPVAIGLDFDAVKQNEFEFETSMYTDHFQNKMNNMLENELSKQIALMIEQRLNEIKVYAESVEVEVAAVESNITEIKNVTLLLDSGYKIRETDIKYTISAITNCSVILTYMEDR